MKRIFCFLIFIVACTSGNFAQQASFTAQTSRQVVVGQRFYLRYTIDQECSGFTAPNIADFNVLSGPDEGRGYSFSDNNGQVSQINYTQYTYVLQATKPGTFTIPAASITVNGKKMQSNSVTITGIAQDNQQTQENSSADDKTNVFIKTSVSNANPYLGEQIIISYKLYTLTAAIKWDYDFLPDYQNFWAHDLLKGAKQLPQSVEVVNGQKYIVAEIRKTALFPQKTGKNVIKPIHIDAQYRVAVKTKKNAANDPFFGSSFANDPFFKSFFEDAFSTVQYQEVAKTLVTNSIEINVKPLPAQGKPVEFNGAIGNFTIKSDFDRNQLKAGEALTIKYTISGSGNLNLLEKPVITFPPDFEAYDPKIVDNFTPSTSSLIGSRTFEYVVVPRIEGSYTIEPAKFAFFNPQRNNHSLLETSPINIKVLKGNANISGNNITKEGIKYTGKDIRYIRNKPLNLQSTGIQFFGSWLFYGLLALLFLFFAGFILFWRKKLNDNKNMGLVRNRRATRIATKRLKNAKLLLNQQKQEPFYEEVSQAIWGYISDKFNIPLSELSMETAENSLNRKQVAPEITSRFIQALQNCEFTRFAPGDKAALMATIYDETLQVIVQTEEQLGGK